MSGGWWYGDDGRKRLIEDEPELPPAPVVLPPPEAPSAEASATDAALDAAWTPSEGPHAPIVGFSTELLGLPLWPAQAALLSELYRDNVREAMLCLGRRSGKDRMASVVGCYEATANAATHLAHVPKGEQVSVVIVANSRPQARICHRLISSYFARPSLRHLVVSNSADTLELSNGMAIRTLACTSRTARGEAVAVAIFDEAAWFLDGDGSPMSGAELYDAIGPATAQFPHAKLMFLSTPRWSTGWFADLCRQAASGAHSDMRYWHATTRTMNPTISDAFLERERAKDPARHAREYEARFASGVGSVFDADTVRAAVRSDRVATVILPTNRYVGAIDVAYVGDTFALAVGHMDGERLIVDQVEGWRGSKSQPLKHAGVLDEVAAIARRYNAWVALDQYAAEPVAQGLAERGISPIRKPWRNELKTDAVTLLRQMFYGHRVELPPHSPLVAELLTLEQRLLPSGRPRYEAPPGGSDDYAHALLALAHELAGQPTVTGRFSMIA